MPANARVLHVGEGPRMFVLLDPNATFIERKFMVIRTSAPFDETGFKSDYIGSVVEHGRGYHVVELVG